MRNVILAVAAILLSLILALTFTVLLQASFEPNRTFPERLGAVMTRQFGVAPADRRLPDPIDRYTGPFDSAPAVSAVDRVLADYDDELRRRSARASEEFGTSFVLALVFFLLSFALTYALIRAVTDFVRWLMPQADA